MERYVYFIAGGGRTKVGLSANPQHRLRDLQVGSPVPLRLLAAVEGTHRLEARVHAELAGTRVDGEWFDGELSADEISSVLRAAGSAADGGGAEVLRSRRERGELRERDRRELRRVERRLAERYLERCRRAEHPVPREVREALDVG